MPVKTDNGRAASRRQEKTETTRARLLQSAEKIFARDGFEAAKLEEIAADAGFTRGALYAHFESKEDLFLELLAQVIEGRIATLEKEMSKNREPEEKLKAMREFFLNKTRDRRWSLLSLEFKLFAVRHPEAKRGLTTMHRRFVDSRVGLLEDVMSSLGLKPAVPTCAIGASLASVGNALMLEHMLDPALMPYEDATKVLARLFDVLTGSR